MFSITFLGGVKNNVVYIFGGIDNEYPFHKNLRNYYRELWSRHNENIIDTFSPFLECLLIATVTIYMSFL